MDEVPWHEKAKSRLASYLQNDRLPHGLLFCGPPGVGKGILALQLAQRLLCATPNGLAACGSCSACQLFNAGTHPDVISLEPEEEGKTLTVDQVRKLSQSLELKPQFGQYRVILINPADRLNRNAANALLKTLEEPGDNNIIILVTDRPSALPITISSRCQTLNVALPDSQTALNWLKTKTDNKNPETLLKISNGAPLKALTLADSASIDHFNIFEQLWNQSLEDKIDPITAVAQLKDIPEAQLIDWMISRLNEQIQRQFSLKSANFEQSVTPANLKDCKSGLHLKELFKLFDQLFDAKRRLESPLNKQLMMEELFISLNQFGRTMN